MKEWKYSFTTVLSSALGKGEFLESYLESSLFILVNRLGWPEDAVEERRSLVLTRNQILIPCSSTPCRLNFLAISDHKFSCLVKFIPYISPLETDMT